MKRFSNSRLLSILLLLNSTILCSHPKGSENQLTIIGSENLDIVEIIRKKIDLRIFPYGQLAETLKAAQQGDAIMLLADRYPGQQVTIDESLFAIIRDKQLRVYLEYPSSVPGMHFGEIAKPTNWRAVVNSNFFRGQPASLQILGINGLHFVTSETEVASPHIVAAQVAGFDSAIYGLPETADPLLFELPSHNLLVATTSFSNFVTGRFAPQQEWSGIWRTILEYLMPGKEVTELVWTPEVTATYGRDEKLPRHYQRRSVERGIDWYRNAKMLVDNTYADSLQQLVDNGISRIQWHSQIPLGDGSNGSLECIFSEIDENGSQPIGISMRGDCISETAMAFALSGKLLKDKESFTIAQNLLDFYLFESIAAQNEYADPNHGAYGLVPWGISSYSWYRANYGDDNARFILATLATSAILKTNRWNEPLVKSLLALLRTTGKNGFRGDRIDLPDFEANGWQYYYQREVMNLSPHFEAYLWACFIWAYHQTGDELFLERVENGIRIMMEHYPDKLIWTNGLAQEKARMLLPLAWLVRVRNTPHNRALLQRVVKDVLALQDESGAIREELGRIEMGRYPHPQSNEAYGTNEASLIAKNGDPVSDLLYTTNFAFLGLHEASYALNDRTLRQAVKRLAAFLCRIQVSSEKHPEIHGGWMRAFDFEKFEHWGSNADAGWGAWAIESGCSQGWITSILALREMDTSIWDLTGKLTINDIYPAMKQEMLNTKSYE
ncbi:hypothetical protein [Proteiniphilum sp. UBA5480]|uniref:hypothetical protein n=1 Tax=Proteiniphilum sp. UBA5480 TaxID=1947282 RepID=UPI00257DEC8E|nr:hypothetical protein [Proteiniphilum sp. UBA5480]